MKRITNRINYCPIRERWQAAVEGAAAPASRGLAEETSRISSVLPVVEPVVVLNSAAASPRQQFRW